MDWPESDPSRRLSESGLVAQISPDRFVPGGFVLSVDGVSQSQVTPGRPETLAFEYIKRIGHLIDLFRPDGQPISVLHLGAGALTLPRYVSASRRGSRSQVIEWERDLVDLVREYLPWDSRWNIRVRYGDAREVVGRLPEGLQGSLDLIIVDLYSGTTTPTHLTTREFYETLGPLLGPHGVVVANIVDGRGGRFARSTAQTMLSLWGFVGLFGEAGIVRGRRFGNIVTVATKAVDEPAWWPELIRRGPHPTASLSGSKLRRYVDGYPIITDDQPLASPQLTRQFLPDTTS